MTSRATIAEARRDAPSRPDGGPSDRCSAHDPRSGSGFGLRARVFVASRGPTNDVGTASRHRSEFAGDKNSIRCPWAAVAGRTALSVSTYFGTLEHCMDYRKRIPGDMEGIGTTDSVSYNHGQLGDIRVPKLMGDHVDHAFYSVETVLQPRSRRKAHVTPHDHCTESQRRSKSALKRLRLCSSPTLDHCARSRCNRTVMSRIQTE